MAIQILKARGCVVYGVCSGKNEQLCKDLGCDKVFDYTLGPWEHLIDEKEHGTFDSVEAKIRICFWWLNLGSSKFAFTTIFICLYFIIWNQISIRFVE